MQDNKCDSCKHNKDCAIQWNLNEVKDLYRIGTTVTECPSYRRKES